MHLDDGGIGLLRRSNARLRLALCLRVGHRPLLSLWGSSGEGACIRAHLQCKKCTQASAPMCAPHLAPATSPDSHLESTCCCFTFSRSSSRLAISAMRRSTASCSGDEGGRQPVRSETPRYDAAHRSHTGPSTSCPAALSAYTPTCCSRRMRSVSSRAATAFCMRSCSLQAASIVGVPSRARVRTLAKLNLALAADRIARPRTATAPLPRPHPLPSPTIHPLVVCLLAPPLLLLLLPVQQLHLALVALQVLDL